MKDVLANLVAQTPSPLQGKNVAREYLQARILESLQNSGAMIPMAFQGGTALRFLFLHGRYSEDLDFALTENRQSYQFRSYLDAIRTDLAREGYPIEISLNDKKTVNTAFVRFPGLLHEMRLSAMRNEALAIKLEVDTNPPECAGYATSVVRRYVILNLHHYDKPSLLAGKLHAILARPYTKGRDIYDLLWYLSDPAWPEPNLTFLNNALVQTDSLTRNLLPTTWKSEVWQKLQSLDWSDIQRDMRPFAEPSFDLNLLSLENFRKLLRVT